VHPQDQQFVVEKLFDVVAFRSFADVLKLLGTELVINHP